MSLAIGPRPHAVPLAEAKPEPRNDTAALEKVANQLQSVFAEQLYKAMRETVPQGEGAFDGGSGEEMFTGLMDQHLAADTPTQWGRGLTDAIVRQLRGSLDQAAGTPNDAPTAAPNAAPTMAPTMTPGETPATAAAHTLQSLEKATR